MFEYLFMAAVFLAPVIAMIVGAMSEMGGRPKRPEQTIWECGWSNPLPNPRYREELEIYEKKMAQWNERRNR
jgi:hypothetical protein